MAVKKRRRSGSRVSRRGFSWDRSPSRRETRRDSKLIPWTLAVTALLSLIAVIAYLVIGPRGFHPDENSARALPRVTPERSDPPTPPPESMEEKRSAALEALLDFANSTSPEQRLAMTADPGLTVAMIEAHASSHPDAQPRSIFNPSVTAVSLHGREILLISFLDHLKRPRSAPFEWIGSSYKLHWEAMNGYGQVPWQVFFTERPRGPLVMRGKIYLSEIAPGSPDAPLTILLTHPDLERPAVIDLAAHLIPTFATFPRSRDVPGIFEITWPEQSDRPLLTRWIQRDWIR